MDWQFVLAVVTASLVSSGLLAVGRWWMERRRKTKKLLTEDAFKRVFDESILPGLTTTIEGMIEERIRAVRATGQYVNLRPTPPVHAPPEEAPFRGSG